MIKKWVLAAFFMVSSAQAATFDFAYFGRHAGGYSMVSCDYAERQVEALFALMGVTEIRTTCFGGVSGSRRISPLHLRVTFQPVVLTEEYRTVREIFRSEPFDTSCDFNARLVRDAVRSVKNVKIVRARDACLGGFQDFEFTLAVKLPR